MYQDELNAKLMQDQMQKMQADEQMKSQVGQAVRGIGAAREYDPCANQAQANGCRRPTLCEEAEKQSAYHHEKAAKHDQAVVFLRENPAFDEFIRLIRAGAIGI